MANPRGGPEGDPSVRPDGHVWKSVDALAKRGSFRPPDWSSFPQDAPVEPPTIDELEPAIDPSLAKLLPVDRDLARARRAAQLGTRRSSIPANEVVPSLSVRPLREEERHTHLVTDVPNIEILPAAVVKTVGEVEDATILDAVITNPTYEAYDPYWRDESIRAAGINGIIVGDEELLDRVRLPKSLKSLREKVERADELASDQEFFDAATTLKDHQALED